MIIFATRLCALALLLTAGCAPSRPRADFDRLLGELRYRHGGEVRDFVLVPDGVVSAQGTVKLWDRRGRLVRSLPAQYGGLLARSEDGTRVAFRQARRFWGLLPLDAEDRLVVYALATGELQASFPLPTDRGSELLGLVFGPEDRGLITFDGRSLRHLDLVTGRELARWELALDGPQDNPDVRLALAPGGVVMGALGQQLLRWDLRQPGRVLPARDGAVVALHPDSASTARYLSARGAWRVDFASGAVERLGEAISPRCAALDRDRRVWTNAAGDSLFVEDGRGLRNAATGLNGSRRPLALRIEGDVAWLACADGVLRRWDLARLQEIEPLDGHTRPVVRLAFSADGRRLASGCRDAYKVWDLAGDALLGSVPLRGVVTPRVALAPAGERLLGAEGEQALVWDLSGAVRFATPAGTGHGGRVLEVCFLDDTRVVTASSDGTVRLWDSATGNEIRTLLHLPEDEHVRALAATTDRLAVRSTRHVFVVSIADGSVLRRLGPLREGGSSLSLSGDGAHLAFDRGADIHTIALADGTGRIERWRQNRIQALALSPDGRQLAIAGDDRTVFLWAGGETEPRALLAQPTWLQSFQSRDEELRSREFLPGEEGWQRGAEPRVGLLQVHPSEPLRDGMHTPGIEALAFSPDGRWLAAGNGLGMIVLWELPLGP